MLGQSLTQLISQVSKVLSTMEQQHSEQKPATTHDTIRSAETFTAGIKRSASGNLFINKLFGAAETRPRLRSTGGKLSLGPSEADGSVKVDDEDS